MKNLNICGYCSAIIEKDEDLCQKCYDDDRIEVQHLDEYFDESLVEEVVSEKGINGLEGVRFTPEKNYLPRKPT